MKKYIKFTLFFCAIFLISSCKKEETQVTPEVQKGHLFLHLHTYVDETEVDEYGVSYTASDERSMSLSIAQFYLSEIALIKADGSSLKIEGVHVLKQLQQDVYELGDVPAGNYRSIRFKVGVDPTTNSTPYGMLQDSTLFKNAEMSFDNSGKYGLYTFLTAKGMIDTTADHSGSMAPFEFRVGTNANYVLVEMPDKNFTVVPNQTEYVHLLADIYRLFNNLKLSDSNQLNMTSVSDNGGPVAQQLRLNISNMFKYEE